MKKYTILVARPGKSEMKLRIVLRWILWKCVMRTWTGCLMWSTVLFS